MLAAVVLASYWAQAEQAPPPPPPPAPPPLLEPPPPSQANGLCVSGRLAYRVGSEGQSLGPALGFSVGGTFEHRTLSLQNGIELGLAADFFYDRFATGVTAENVSALGTDQTGGATRVLAETSFAVLQTVAWRSAALRPFVGLGLGVEVAYFSSPEVDLRPGTMSAVQPLARGTAGVDVTLSPTTALTFRGDYTHTFTRPTYTTSDLVSYSLFGDLVDVGIGLLIRF